VVFENLDDPPFFPLTESWDCELADAPQGDVRELCPSRSSFEVASKCSLTKPMVEVSSIDPNRPYSGDALDE
jgi:hypothetical protein